MFSHLHSELGLLWCTEHVELGSHTCIVNLDFCEVLSMSRQVLTFDSELGLLWCAEHTESGSHTCTVSSLYTEPLYN